ncbi:uncharacterized protein LOC130924371 isoform X2 [Corythoichthys intestinalis]|uniref:uncharacterized protein LOC130924371 isoform X2 n=1 Tax=Corythoichthys intestinalis TaxID=161448 RepID=UPI0025A5A455|nr:uncharacterized protein LOC130924371 isoform X2 [Corythoichthys intestinalis]
MQDPPGIQLYVSVKTVVLNGVQLNKYRCRRGSNSLEGLHAHLYNAIPSSRCGIMPFQVYLIAFAVQWNTRMESLRVAGGQGRQTTCMDARQIQRMNHHAEVLFGKQHMLEPNFAAPLPYPDQYQHPEEEELLGVEYALCQSTAFTPRQYYAQKVEEEQAQQEEEEVAHGEEGEEPRAAAEEQDDDEGVAMEEEVVDPVDGVCVEHAALTQAVKVEEEESPALQDVLVSQRHLHLPGIEEVEALALLLLELADEDDRYLVSVDLRRKISLAAGSLYEHDKTTSSFVKKYESRWGYTLFGRCLGLDTPESSAAQKTKFGWMSKVSTSIKGRYRRIADRVRDDPVLCSLSIPLPNINSKSISSFLRREEKVANYRATVQPRAKPHRTVLSDQRLPDAPALPSSLPQPERPQVQYEAHHHIAGKRRGEKRRLDFDDANPVPQPQAQSLTTRPIQPKPATSTSASALPSGVSAAPILLVVPAQPRAPSVQFAGPSCGQLLVSVLPPPAPKVKPIMPNKSHRPCGACQVPQCGGMRKRYMPSKDKVGRSSQKLFTFCPKTGKSTTPGFEDVYTSYEHFKSVVDKELEKRNTQPL